MKFRIFIFLLASLLCVSLGYSKTYDLLSPDKKIKIQVLADKDLKWSVSRQQEILLDPGTIALYFSNGRSAGTSPAIDKVERTTVSSTITSIVPIRSKQIPEHYNELKLVLKGGFAVVFRAYNDGVAYRFESALSDAKVQVVKEIADFNFNENCEVYLPQEKDPEMQSHYEGNFKRQKFNEISDGQYGFLPLHISTGKGTKMVVTESDLYDYPNMFLFGSGGNSLKANFPKVILENKLKPKSDRSEIIVRKADYIAETKGARTFPWRTIIISPDDRQLLENELVYKLSSPNVIADPSWIKPGKVAWDWWNANNIYGVDFKSGINTDTYKYYIDFASEYGLEYIILDEGWSLTTTNLLATTPDLNIEELIRYGKSKNVGVILWALWQPLDKDMDRILDRFVKWGAAGIKVDFMARADQYMVNYYERVAAAAAKRKLLVDLHGAYKPVGLNRKYPNVVNYEGVRGLENNKWEETITPEHNVTLPFTRMVAGPMDYTPGAMINATKKNFHITFTEPMSMGTRAHQAAMYVIYDSPLQMLADNPSNYRKEPDFTRFIAQMPTTWDKTIGLAGEAGKYVVTARKNGSKWYIGAMTNWDEREIKVDLSFLEPGKYKMQILQDGVNADKHAADYKILKDQDLTSKSITAKLASGGGWVAVITPEK
ncbi:glycoside hydrolase family 97 protein [Desertivirga arenae]|uniref:glycoside hydrolase family 97 protein n=1 Tax=Desertivirga arenae TaxID=2810309 RepID=UPI001A96529A|nr:glycoside hydrolase family 97 protein [Pedobacter sp. SYSU D00823]